MAYKYLGEKYTVSASWSDSPHLSEDAKASLLLSIPEYQRDARSKGIPQLGSGAIYPISEDNLRVAPFPIPSSWPRSAGMDVGIRTACVWGARNPDTGVIFVYREYYREGLEPSYHASNIMGQNGSDKWIPIVIDPAARGRTAIDGRRLIDMYRDLGLNVTESENAVDAGLGLVWDAMVAGQLKVFSNLTRWFQEVRTYQRDTKGNVVKKRDEEMDCTRYLWLSGRDRMAVKPQKTGVRPAHIPSTERAWMA